MASESPSSKKRKVLQPTIKCFMNSKQPQSDGAEEASKPKPSMGRNRAGPRAKAPKSVFRDQPPIQIFMNADSSSTKANVQKENGTVPEKPASPSANDPTADANEANGDDATKTEEQPSKMDQAAKLDINLSPEIILFMKSVCLRHPASRTQADMTLLKMILDFNPQLRKGDEPLVWLRMQKSLAQMAIKVQEEMVELRRQREAAAAAAQIAAAAAAAAARATLDAHEAERLRFLNHIRMQEAAMHRDAQSSRERLKREHERRERERRESERREIERRDRERREQIYNQQLYNTVHNFSSATSLTSSAQQQQPQQQPSEQQQQQQPPMTDAQWDGLRQTVLRQIGNSDKDAASLVRFIYKNFPPKGKIRVGDEAISQIAQLQQRKQDPDSKKKLKMLLLKVIQDYHPDKVDEQLGEKWKSISEDIAKRVTKYYEGLK